jgi:probable addiction module antidote protein
MPTKFSAFDAAEYLDSEEAIAAYLNEVLAEDDQDLLLSALDDVARARGMTQVADAAGLTRPGLYKALKPGAKTGFVTVRKIAGALGLQFSLTPVPKKSKTQIVLRKVRTESAGVSAAATAKSSARRKAHA